jgi:hypothetical protein
MPKVHAIINEKPAPEPAKVAVNVTKQERPPSVAHVRVEQRDRENEAENATPMGLSDALRAHASRIEEAGWPTPLSRDLRRAAEQIEWLEAITKDAPAHGEGPAPRSETENKAAKTFKLDRLREAEKIAQRAQTSNMLRTWAESEACMAAEKADKSEAMKRVTASSSNLPRVDLSVFK